MRVKLLEQVVHVVRVACDCGGAKGKKQYTHKYYAYSCKRDRKQKAACLLTECSEREIFIHKSIITYNARAHNEERRE